jgi:simple sugar transport system ATP-binding protein
MVGDDAVDPIALGLVDVERADRVVGGAPSDTLRVPWGAGGGTGSGPGASGDVVVRLVGAERADRAGPGVRGADLEVRRGEIVGVAGVDGNGQRALALLVSGREAPDAGRVQLPEGIGFIPQDRSTEGLIADFDLVENIGLALHREPGFVRGPWIRWDAVREAAERIRERFGVAAPSVSARAGTLSGGNQQRVIVGRELTLARDLLVAENPTRGLDVAAAAFVHAELKRLVSEGVGVLLVSTDLDEVLGLADRVYAIARGRLYEVPEDRRTREGVGALMLGGAGDA